MYDIKCIFAHQTKIAIVAYFLRHIFLVALKDQQCSDAEPEYTDFCHTLENDSTPAKVRNESEHNILSTEQENNAVLR